MRVIIYENYYKGRFCFLDDNKKKDNGIPITEPEKNDEAPCGSADENELCILCEKNAPDKSFGEDYDLCTECRRRLIRSRFRFKGVLALIAVISCALWGFMFLSNQGANIETMNEGYKYLDEKKPNEALSRFGSVYNMGWKTARKLIDVCFNLGSIDDVNYLISNYFYDDTAVVTNENGTVEKLQWKDKAGQSNVNAPWNKEVKKMYDFITSIDTYASACNDVLYPYTSKLSNGTIKVEEIPYDELIKKYDEMEAKATTNAEKGVINYYKVAASSVCEKDTKVQYEYCLKIAEYLPECTWMYLDNLVVLSIRSGYYEDADKHIKTIIEINGESDYTDLYYSLNLRYQGKYDEAMVYLEKIMANPSSELSDVYYEALLCQFLSGNYEKAYEYASLCFNDEYYLTVETINFYALLSKKLGMDTGYDAAANFLSQAEMKLSPTVDKYLNGEITNEQLFRNGEVVFE